MVMSSEPTGPAKPAKGPASGKPKAVVHDLEIKDAQIIFHSVWNELEQDLGDVAVVLDLGFQRGFDKSGARHVH